MGRLRTVDGVPVCTYEATEQWRGRCPSCGRPYNCQKFGRDIPKADKSSFAALAAAKPKPRVSTGIPQFDEVTGGGIPYGSVVIISGPPGSGKTTLLVKIANNVATEKRPVIYASGEQTVEAVGEFVHRLGAATPDVPLNKHVVVKGLEGDIYQITEEAEETKPALIVIDSLQTAELTDVKAVEGSAEQCKAVTNYLTAWAGRNKIAILLVSHINKEGDVAGPKAIEHLVDAMLEFDPAVEFDEDGDEIEETKGYRKLTMAMKSRIAPEGSVLFNMTREGVIKPVSPEDYAGKKKKKSKLVTPGEKPDGDGGKSPRRRLFPV